MTLKVHSKRTGAADPVADARVMQKLVNQLRGCGVARRGVYRFTTHEEASSWQIRQMAELHAHRSSTTSSSSAAG